MDDKSLLVQQGLDLMFFGMSTVFIFLAVLVVVTSAMSRIILLIQPLPAPPAEEKPMADTRHIAIISAALAHHLRHSGEREDA